MDGATTLTYAELWKGLSKASDRAKRRPETGLASSCPWRSPHRHAGRLAAGRPPAVLIPAIRKELLFQCCRIHGLLDNRTANRLEDHTSGAIVIRLDGGRLPRTAPRTRSRSACLRALYVRSTANHGDRQQPAHPPARAQSIIVGHINAEDRFPTLHRLARSLRDITTALLAGASIAYRSAPRGRDAERDPQDVTIRSHSRAVEIRGGVERGPAGARCALRWEGRILWERLGPRPRPAVLASTCS